MIKERRENMEIGHQKFMVEALKEAQKSLNKTLNQRYNCDSSSHATTFQQELIGHFYII